jgi:hypothetical protein
MDANGRHNDDNFHGGTKVVSHTCSAKADFPLFKAETAF